MTLNPHNYLLTIYSIIQRNTHPWSKTQFVLSTKDQVLICIGNINTPELSRHVVLTYAHMYTLNPNDHLSALLIAPRVLIAPLVYPGWFPKTQPCHCCLY